MLTLLSEINFFPPREDDIVIRDIDFGIFKNNEYKKESTSTSDKYNQAKRDYGERRSKTQAQKRQHAKLKNYFRTLEEELKSKKIVFCEWSDHKTLLLMLSNGLIIYLEFNVSSGELQRINFDKYFIGKIVSESICDVIILRNHILISYSENQISFVHLQKPSLKNSTQKISQADPKIFNIIIGGQTKKVHRHLVINPSFDLVLIWTKSSQNEFFPWRPSVKDQEWANLHIYKINRLKFEPLCYFWTQNDPICFEFSKFNESEIYSVEQKITKKGEVTIESCTYQISNNKTKLQRTQFTSIPLQTEVSCNAFSPDHEKLLLGCIDGSIVIFDEGREITYMVKASFIPTHLAWHPDSAIVMIANERSLQCFDISLSCIKNQLLTEDVTPSNILDLSSFFVRQPQLLKMCWSKKPDISNHYEQFAQVDCFLLTIFETGIFSILRYVGGSGLKNDIHTSGLTADVIIQHYITLNQIDKAVNVLSSLNWDVYGAMCLLSLHKIANYIFKLPATAERENLLQKALASFHVPTKPLCTETESEFGDNVDDLTRRYFHYLIRYKSFDKAFSLAIDINDADLFMILCKCAKAHNFNELATESLKKADEIYAKEEDDSHHSTCSITSCSICSNSSDTEDDASSRSSDIPDTFQQTGSQKTLRKSFTAELLNHPPLPRFTNKQQVKRSQINSNENTACAISSYVPPLPHVTATLDNQFNLKTATKNVSLSNLASDMRASKFSSIDDFNRVVDVVPKPKLNMIDIDQTIGIPLFEPTDSSIISDEPFVPTTVHEYPLISGTIPAAIGTPTKLSYNTLPASKSVKKDSHVTQSILANSSNCGTNLNAPTKNKVKFSDTITVAVVPEISRKEKLISYNERMKRKTIYPGIIMDPKRELAESLPLCHPNEDWLKDFSPVAKDQKPSSSGKSENHNDKKQSTPNIKVVHFGVV